MLKRLGRRRPSASLAISCLALFIALGGTTYAATGGNFILGVDNPATTQTRLTASASVRTLQLTNTSTTAGSSALGLNVVAGHAPFSVNSTIKVANLNSDYFDGADSTAFLRKGLLQSANVAAGGVLNVNNTGTGNGVQGKTSSASASGVYGENTSTGYGVAGRASGTGTAVFGDNTGGGYAGWFNGKVHVDGNLELTGNLDCTGCVDGSDVTGKVSDADTLDGIDSSGFVQGGGRAVGQAIAEGPGVHLFLGPPIAGFLRLSYACPSTLTDNGTLKIYNDSGTDANVFVESGTANPSYFQLAALGQINLGGSATGDSYHIQAQGALGVLTIEAASVHRASDCHAQAQGLLAN